MFNFFKPRLTEESVIRFYLDNNLTMTDDGYVFFSQPSAPYQHESNIQRTVSNVVRAIDKEYHMPFSTYKGALKDVLYKAHRHLANYAQVSQMTEKLMSEKVEVLRSRLMVRAVREGLDRTEEFYQILDATNLLTLDALERRMFSGQLALN